MEKPETETTATRRQVWNAGKKCGANRALKRKNMGDPILSQLTPKPS